MHLLEIADQSLPASLAKHLVGIKRGIEKESLRIQPDGYISQQNHPHALGATLTNPHITTDYSEALPEFITGASSDRLQPLAELMEIHQFAYQNLENSELLWAMSMPCVMGEENDIPIARYGHSNSGRMKEIYRMGLGLRYGRFMQTIAGVHYNFSLPESFWQALHQSENSEMPLQDFISQKYMGLIRNYLRFSWLIPLFFGASPALCESFIKDKNIDLEQLVPGTRYGRFATSLRMSDLGYQNNAQSGLSVNYNCLNEYIKGLEDAISTPDPYYQEIGVTRNGDYQQLNANVLQIENEFYSSIRPKRVSVSGERPTKALRNRGIEYIEVRALDLNPFSPIGIDQSQIAFLDSLLLACLFAKSEPINPREKGEYQSNFKTIVSKGRHPDCCLTMNNGCVPVNEVATELMSQIEPYAALLDKVYQTNDHGDVLSKLRTQLSDLDKTYSGRIVKSIEQRQDGFFPYAMEIAQAHKAFFEKEKLNTERLSHYQQEATLSHQKKLDIENSDTKSFEEFLAHYYE
ncbi:glutamate--cysteine ligase [Aliikangiella coralliicola]|uniref:Glutamate--cysteine ligase n=1 Tax=Aliikangiella coralliicola TaxID=2592383 RepID=A0A545TWG3_9GAMM|nr:glutamate--cysteine ligase [Aliikangiella coralliicola]TQV81549.1 glutamate--cysteine ligase [Aliikangiella coralliicola]